MEEKKTSILALYEILEEYSDEDHILRQPELLNLLKEKYNINLDRRTLYKNVEMLIDYGYDISPFSENGVGYYLRERQFEKSEVYLLCNAIHSSNYIPKKSSNELIDKLLKTQSKFYKSKYKSMIYVDNNRKKDNKEFFLNIELLSEAITSKQTVSFNYLTYDKNKKLVNKRNELYNVSPYYLVNSNEKTYLIAKSVEHEDLAHYRIDKMSNIKITKDKYIHKSRNSDPYEYSKNKIYMYHGQDVSVTLRCDYEILDDVIDNFGKDVPIYEDDATHFITRIKSSKQGIVYLALQYLNHMEVLDPSDIRQEIADTLKKGAKKYKK